MGGGGYGRGVRLTGHNISLLSLSKYLSGDSIHEQASSPIVGGHQQPLNHLKGSLTPPKFNMEPENNGFEMDFPFPGIYFQVPY